VTFLRVLILWVQEQHHWRRMVSKWIVWGEQFMLNNQDPIETQWLLAMEYTNQYRLLLYWFCECQSSKLETDGLQILYEGSSLMLNNQDPIETQLTPCDGIHHISTETLYVYWFCECQSSTTGGRMVPNELCGGEQSHAYIIKTQLKHHWLLAMEYLTSGTVTLLREGFCDARPENWRRMVQMNCVGESSLMLT